MTRWIFSLALLFACPIALSADSLRQLDLPPEAEWVVHVDFDALMANELTREMVTELIATEYLQNQLGSIPADLLPMLAQRPAGVTVVAPSEGDSVLFVVDSIDEATFVEAIAQSPSYVRLSHAGAELHHWKTDMNRVADHFNQPSEPSDQDEETDEEDVVAFYVAITQDDRVAISNDLRWLVEWIERTTQDQGVMSDAEFEERFGNRPDNSIVVVDHLPPSDAVASASEMPFDILRATIWADDKVRFRATVDMRGELMAETIMRMAEPRSLAQQVAAIARQAHATTASDDATGDTPLNDSVAQEDLKDTLQFGAGFKGFGIREEVDEEEIARFFESTSRIARDGSLLTVEWFGHANLTYTHRFEESGRNHHVFHAWLGETAAEARRMAQRDSDESETRRR